MSNKNTKYTFETSGGRGPTGQTAVVSARTKQEATEKLCVELGVKELPDGWRLAKFEIK